MSGFNTKNKNEYGEYEITFYTKDYKKYRAVQDFCRNIKDEEDDEQTLIAIREGKGLTYLWK